MPKGSLEVQLDPLSLEELVIEELFTGLCPGLTVLTAQTHTESHFGQVLTLHMTTGMDSSALLGEDPYSMI